MFKFRGYYCGAMVLYDHAVNICFGVRRVNF